MTGEQEPMKRTPGQWHVDRNLSFGLIVTLILQFIGLIMWGSTITVRQNEMGREVMALQLRPSAASNSEARVSVIESQLSSILAAIQTTNQKLDQVILGRADRRSPSRLWNE